MKKRRRARGRASIQDVAGAAGVSIMTVSRAMRGVEGVSASKRAEIVKIARRMGYQPSRVAGSLAADNSSLIAISLPTLFDAVFAEILEGMRGTLHTTGFDTVIDTTEYHADWEETWVQRMIAWRPAGIILSGVHHTVRTRRHLRASGIPTLEIWDYSDTPIDLCVGFDHFAAGGAMGRHLAGLGYRRPAYVGVDRDRDRRAEDRLRGLQTGFAEADTAFANEARLGKPASFEAGRIGTADILDGLDSPPDVFCYLNDHMAFGGMMECERRGFRIPEDIGIAGFNGLGINRVLPKPLTTSITERSLMGATGARMLVAKIKGAKTKPQVLLPVQLYPGETTCRQAASV